MTPLAARWIPAVAVALSLHLPAHAAIVADSIADFSNAQGAGGWQYGYYNRTANGPYSSGAFTLFDTFNVARWEASDAQVGANNNDFLNTNALGGHPTGLGPALQDAVIWAMRRYVSEVAGPIRVDYDLHKLNTTEPLGGGITGRIFVDGIEMFTQFIANDDGTGVIGALLLDVGIGTLIDFVIDPTGVPPTGSNDNPASARADGSQFSALISSRELGLPEPAAWSLLAVGLMGWGMGRRLQG